MNNSLNKKMFNVYIYIIGKVVYLYYRKVDKSYKIYQITSIWLFIYNNIE